MTTTAIANTTSRQISDPSVSFSNAITRAAHGLTLPEKRIVMLSVAKLDSMKPFVPGESPTVRVTAKEYAEMYDLDLNTAYDQLIIATKELFERKITFFSQSKNGTGTPKLRAAVRWVGGYKYQEGEGWAELGFWHEVVPYLMDLSAHFTTYKLKHASNLKSVYSWRLLEIFSQYKKNHWIELTIAEFCHAMNATDKMATDFNYIRRKIIDPAATELQDDNGWIINWKTIKKGRKVTGLRFDYLLPHESNIQKRGYTSDETIENADVKKPMKQIKSKKPKAVNNVKPVELGITFDLFS